MPVQKKEDKSAEGFQISQFHWLFSNDITAVTGLISAQLLTDAISAFERFWVLIRLCKQHGVQARTLT